MTLFATDTATLPQLEDGHPQAVPVFLDLYWAFGMGYVDGAFVKDLFTAFVAMVRKTAFRGQFDWPLGQIRTTTVHPMGGRTAPPNYKLRPGEYLRVAFVPGLLAVGGTGGGLTINGYEDNRSLYDPMECWVCIPAKMPQYMAAGLGRTAFHECGHFCLPRSGKYGDQHQHSQDPNNFLYGGGLAADPLVSPQQVAALDWNLTRCRVNGLRANPSGRLLPEVRVYDGGRPAWPMRELS